MAEAELQALEPGPEESLRQDDSTLRASVAREQALLGINVVDV